MKFLELNKKRHGIRQFNDQPVDFKDVRTAIEIATLAPSANNIQPWKFVVVSEKKDALASIAMGHNADQIRSSQYTIAIFSDNDLAQRARKIARIGGAQNFSEDMLAYFMQTLPARFDNMSEVETIEFLSLNAGLVAMNLVLALTDQGMASNMILGFNKDKINDILDIDKRFRGELLVTVGYSDDKVEPSYRLPVDEVIEER